MQKGIPFSKYVNDNRLYYFSAVKIVFKKNGENLTDQQKATKGNKSFRDNSLQNCLYF